MCVLPTGKQLKVNEPRERTNANHLVCARACSQSSLSPPSSCQREKGENADSVTNVKLETKRNLCFLSSSLRRALINKLVVERTDLFPLLILDERVSDRIYANQLSLCVFLLLNGEKNSESTAPNFSPPLSLLLDQLGTSFIRNFRSVVVDEIENEMLY